MDHRITYTLLFLISCVILPMHGKTVDKLESAKEIEKAPESMKDDDVGASDEHVGDEPLLNSNERIKAEFLTFNAPEEDDIEDENQIEDLLELLKPKQILLIEAVENTTIIEFNAAAEERSGLAEALLFGENSSFESVKKSKNTTIEKV
ncbi:uncharacterized protein LOC105220401 [Zeugodacus cucurbitae]|uniref:uncharacterized protein LOC105220401 n=1 Tax=Zeugodacus cucurbitae TaxID=28588 RepID=UPI0023D92670|nr:uncharacterized protein LOC105220401 [Zeugodacus cucurbitae]